MGMAAIGPDLPTKSASDHGRYRRYSGSIMLTSSLSANDPQETFARKSGDIVGAGLKPALLCQTPLARCSLGHPPTARDYSRCKRECDCLRGGFEARPYNRVASPRIRV